MTGPDPATVTNVATDSAHVDVQAAVVHGGIHYTTSADASAQERFDTGVHFLDGGVPARAWRLIDQAITDGYRTDKTRFYWLLALVSGRTRNELSGEEADMLRNRRNLLPLDGEDVWADGVEVTHRLLDSAERPESDIRVLFKEFDRLGDTQRGLILKHLELFLDGPLRDDMWSRALRRAEQEQMAADRKARVWKFFEPDPAPPRARLTAPPAISAATWAQALAGAAVLAVATINVGYLLMRAGRLSALAAFLLSIAGGYLGARNGVEWCFRARRRRAKDEEHAAPGRRRTTTRPEGFARKADRLFIHYFAKYVPEGTDRSAWLAATAGVRKSIRDEMVEVYRESGVGADRIAWLIRHRVGVVKKRWENGTFLAYRTELATPLRTRATAVLGLIALIGGGLWAVDGAMPAGPRSVAFSTSLLLAGGWFAAHAWLHILIERRRYAADETEREHVLERSQEAYTRWRAKLEDRPEDREMAAWLDCDRKLLLGEVLEHYKLKMSALIADGFIEAPAASTTRARIRGGPWRYRRYRLLLFLLTADGVRQLEVGLHFEQGTFHDRQRTNFRYDAVAAVRVRQADDDERTFELALVNGQKIKVQVIGPGMEELVQGENPGEVSEVTLDAAGLQHTLHVLEGIAAEGKPWIIRKKRRDG